MIAEQDDLRRKYDELSRAFKEKSRKVLHLQELYDKVKRKAELGHIQKAASDAVDSTIQATQLEHGYGDGIPPQGHVEGHAEGHTMPVFNHSHRVDVSGMNTSLPRNFSTVSREGTQWPRLGGSPHRECLNCTSRMRTNR
jgi:E3 ubiquitin-protein ligase CCNP1IP1